MSVNVLYNLILTVYMFSGEWDSQLVETNLTQQECASMFPLVKEVVNNMRKDDITNKVPKQNQIDVAVAECKAVDNFKVVF